jgi:hypothetical protein
LGPAPYCPNCGASLATDARYQRILVPGGPSPEVTAGPDATAADESDAADTFGDDDPDLGFVAREPAEETFQGNDPDLTEALMVTVVYCEPCGTALGTI